MTTIVFNIRGTRFEVPSDLLKAIPYSTLARLDKSSEYFNSEKNEYYFNRDPDVFNSILNLLNSKELHIPRHICGGVIRKELAFWRIQEQTISRCCWHSFYEYEQDKIIFEKLDNLIVTKEADIHRCDDDPFRIRLWKLMTDPGYSRAALVWHYFFICVVLLSTVIFCLWTIPDFRTPPYLYQMPPPDPNATIVDINQKLIHIVIYDAKPPILVFEGFCLVVITLDLAVSLIFCPSKKAFFKNGLNIIHIVVFVFMFTSFSMEFLKGQMAGKPALGYVYFIVKALNMVRIFLLARLERTFQGFRVLLLALRASAVELFLMVFGFVVLTLFYSSVIFYFEIYGEEFYNIFICMWWAIITMTTVGYGDYYPKTTGGYIVGVCCATSGILLISMPVAVIASNFSTYYQVHGNVLMHEKTKARERKKSYLEKLVRNLHGQTLRQIELKEKDQELTENKNSVTKHAILNGTKKPPLVDLCT